MTVKAPCLLDWKLPRVQPCHQVLEGGGECCSQCYQLLTRLYGRRSCKPFGTPSPPQTKCEHSIWLPWRCMAPSYVPVLEDQRPSNQPKAFNRDQTNCKRFSDQPPWGWWNSCLSIQGLWGTIPWIWVSIGPYTACPLRIQPPRQPWADGGLEA